MYILLFCVLVSFDVELNEIFFPQNNVYLKLIINSSSFLFNVDVLNNDKNCKFFLIVAKIMKA